MAFEIEIKHLHCGESPRAHADDHATGCREISNGMYGRVFDDSGANQVIKVFNGWDAGYIAYLEVMCELEIDNPHLPKIHHVVLYKNGTDVYQHAGVVYMEKLAEGKLREISTETGCREGPKTWHEKVCDRIRMIAWATNEGEEFNSLSRKSRELLAILQLARERAQKAAPDHCVNWDLHTGNIMWRGPTWVVTDPLS